jgi:hypothetical protein
VKEDEAVMGWDGKKAVSNDRHFKKTLRLRVNKTTHRSRFESVSISFGLSSPIFSDLLARAFSAFNWLFLLGPIFARVRSTPSSYPSPFTPRTSSLAYVLRTINASGSSPVVGVNGPGILVLVFEVARESEASGGLGGDGDVDVDRMSRFGVVGRD